ncbi:hypothetical protein OP10G_4404 [Fimbriimonas ginsengisoli Gsoil 348]|uniref:Uncharacterized protein n=1 Tax=Fimbriimonas ginsengisoli Gsoil 348 TaxID=661478 RepID=A0A068NWM8_FIMGI|nr:hypothetical protein OP10G_4404 [Fimbriimonas ginsengisoli Gsoil 348]
MAALPGMPNVEHAASFASKPPLQLGKRGLESGEPFVDV